MMEWLALGLGAAGIGAAAYGVMGMRQVEAPKNQDFLVPADALPIADAATLLARNGLLVHSIRMKVGLSSANLARDLMPMLEAYAGFVQLLPASEAHHHAQPGGLLQHTLEVVDFALTIRRNYVLPLNAEAERINALKHVWTFGVAIAALLHDIGKTIADQHITLYGPALPSQGRLWQPMVGSMKEQGAHAYRLAFNDSRDYEDHARMGVMLMQRVVPAHVLAWLGEKDPDLLKQVLDVLSNPQCSNVVKEIVKKADIESTRQNLLTGPKSRFKTARETPLIDLLDQGLTRLLESGKLRLNVPGGHGFVWGDENSDLLLVVPRVIDALRELLSGSLSEESRGIPSDNLVIYGTWQDYGRLRSTEAGKAVWRITVEGIPKSLTVLRFPRGSGTFKTLTQWPSAFDGGIEVHTASVDDDDPTPSPQAQSREAVAPSDVVEAAPVEQPLLASPLKAESADRPFWMEGDADAPTSSPGVIPPSIAAARSAESDAVNQGRASGGLMPPEETPATPVAASVASNINAARSMPPVKKALPAMKDPARRATSAAEKQENLEAFEDWLRIGLKSGHVRYNDGKSVLHFHREGDATVALLISPAVYQRFAKEKDPERWSKVEVSQISRETWVPLQSALLKAHAHKSQQEGKIKRTVFKYATKGSGVFQCNVLTNPQTLFQDVPEPNPYISGELKSEDLMKMF